jgi:sodium transport system permease protein
MWLVFKKELLELLRDRKTLFFMVALPIAIFPLLFGGVAYFMSQAVSEAQTKTLNFAIIGEQYGAELAEQLSKVESLSLQSIDSTLDNDEQKKALVRDGEVDFIIEIPSNYGSDLINTGQIVIKLFLNDAQLNSVQSRLNKIINE